MGAFIVVLTIAALAGLTVWWHRGRRTSPFSSAFSATAAATLFLVAGSIGCDLGKRDVISGIWTGGVVWWEIWFGIVASVIAVYFWRKALRTLP